MSQNDLVLSHSAQVASACQNGNDDVVELPREEVEKGSGSMEGIAIIETRSLSQENRGLIGDEEVAKKKDMR